MASDPGALPIPDPKRHESKRVAQMFGSIAPSYDLLNHLLSLNVDRLWRRAAVKSLAPEPGGFYLDLCTGTGDLAFSLLKRVPARVLGVDFSGPMLDLAREKARRRGASGFCPARGDAMCLPLRAASVDGAMVAFGVRNFENLERGLGEMARVLRSGGRAVILEFSEPRGRLFGAVYRWYFRALLPRIGRLVSGSSGAYAYLPASVEAFPDAEALAGLFDGAGFEVLRQRPLTGGIATLHILRRTATGSPGGGGA